jgi:seryl-tRNA synthetase
VLQFEKVEQFVICSPEGGESWKIQEDMIKVSEEFYQVRQMRPAPAASTLFGGC